MSILPFLFDLADELTGLTSGDGSILNEDYNCYNHDFFGYGGRQRCPRLYLTYPRRWRQQHSHSPYSTLARRDRIASAAAANSNTAAGVVNQNKEIDGSSAVGKDGFQVCMEVTQFKPNELTVKTVDNTIVVEGKHEEREDEHGLIWRHFIRRYTLPKGYDPKDVVSTLSSDGILTLKAPLPPSKGQKGKKERLIQIQQTGPAHLSIKENPKDDGEQKQQKQQQQQQQNGDAEDKMQE